jgi:flagellar biosynthesis/type III secretory pathway ATPase
VVLDRAIAARAHYPAIDVTQSISRVMNEVAGSDHVSAAAALRSLLAAFEEKRDLVTLGAYTKGSDARLDAALRALPELEQFLRQDSLDVAPFEATLATLKALAKRHTKS